MTMNQKCIKKLAIILKENKVDTNSKLFDDIADLCLEYNEKFNYSDFLLGK